MFDETSDRIGRISTPQCIFGDMESVASKGILTPNGWRTYQTNTYITLALHIKNWFSLTIRLFTGITHVYPRQLETVEPPHWKANQTVELVEGSLCICFCVSVLLSFCFCDMSLW